MAVCPSARRAGEAAGPFLRAGLLLGWRSLLLRERGFIPPAGFPRGAGLFQQKPSLRGILRLSLKGILGVESECLHTAWPVLPFILHFYSAFGRNLRFPPGE